MQNKIKGLKLTRAAGWMLIHASILMGIYVIGNDSLEYDLLGKIVFYSLTVIFCLNIPMLVILPKSKTTNILLSIGLFLLSADVLVYDLYTWVLFLLTIFSVYLYSQYKSTEISKEEGYATAYHCFFGSKATPFLVIILGVFTVLYFTMFFFFEMPFKIMDILRGLA